MKNEFYNQNNNPFGLNMVMCGEEECDLDFKMPPHLREYYLIHYVQRGMLFYEENGNKHRVSEGDIFLICPDVLTTYYSANENVQICFCWIAFKGKEAKSYLDYIGLSMKNPVVHLDNNNFERAVLKAIKLFDSPYHPTEISLNTQLLKCLESIENTIKPYVKESTNYVDTSLAYIEDNYMKDITSRDVADFVNLNRSYLFKIFKKQTGISVSRCLINYRINKACDFLKDYDFTVSRVAQMVGIEDIYYFSKVFKKITGFTPTEYRKNKKANNT